MVVCARLPAFDPAMAHAPSKQERAQQAIAEVEDLE